MRPLFIAGCPRSGTSAFTNYLIVHPSVLVTMERYDIGMDITPDLFTPERLADFRDGDTGQPPEPTMRLLKNKDWSQVKWIGDKRPTYFLKYDELREANPGAHFFYLYRPLDEVARSFLARDWKFGIEDAIRFWKVGLTRTRRLAESGAPVMVVGYRSFFTEPEPWLPVLSSFLDVEFGEDELKVWRARSAAREGSPESMRPLSPEEEAMVSVAREGSGERWALRRIDEQLGAGVAS